MEGTQFSSQLNSNDTASSNDKCNYKTILYKTEGRIATITLNRPEHLNAIDQKMPTELQDAVERANWDSNIHVIILEGSGRAFCSGYDLKLYAENTNEDSLSQKMPWDPLIDYQIMGYNTQCFMSLFRSLKPVICKVQGFAIAGGSDIALCCDIVVAEENAKFGYPPARIWGCPTTFMWVYRLGAEKAKRLLLTGDVISAKEARDIGLISFAVPANELDSCVKKLAERMCTVPKNQLMMQKLVVNKAYENMGLNTTQTLATLMDGIARHSPEGIAFKRRCEEVGFKQAVKERDAGVFDLSQYSSRMNLPNPKL